MDRPSVIRKDERIVHVILVIRDYSSKNTKQKRRTLIVKTPPEQHYLERLGLIYDALPFFSSMTTATSELGAMRPMCKRAIGSQT